MSLVDDLKNKPIIVHKWCIGPIVQGLFMFKGYMLSIPVIQGGAPQFEVLVYKP